MAELMNTIAMFVAGILTVSVIVNHIVIPYLQRKVKAIEQEIREDSAAGAITLEVEMVNDQYYCYNDDTKEFVCQGYSLTEITKRFSERHPGRLGELFSTDKTVVERLAKDIPA